LMQNNFVSKNEEVGLVLQLYFSASLSIVRLLGFSLMVTSPD